MSQANVLLFDGEYTPHDYLKKAIIEMKDYCLPYGQVKIANQETGAIVAIILYVLAKEPKAVRTKLECYIILLNKLIREETCNDLFTWKLNNKGRVSSFSKFWDYMLMSGLLLSNGRSRFYVLGGAGKIIARLPIMLDRLLPYLNKILVNYEDYTAGEILEKTCTVFT